MPVGVPGAVDVAGLRVAWYDDDGIAAPSPETARTVRDAARALADAGLRIDEARPPEIVASLEITKRYWRSSELNGEQIEHLMRDWDAFRTALLTFMERYDAILCPASDRPALPHGTSVDERFSYTIPFSLTGYPCVVVRAGTSVDGLPIGVQVIARPWRDDVALALAGQVERALGGWRRPPL
jgi:amidase